MFEYKPFARNRIDELRIMIQARSIGGRFSA